MNMLREFFNYFFSAMLGKRSSLTAFLEPLTMGERYLRWGMETRDIRDFRTAMDYLHLCHDRDAPMATLLMRKYNCIGDVTAAAVESLLMKHQLVIDNSIRRENTLRDELVVTRRKVEESRQYAQRLMEEGSLLKSKDEEARAAKFEETARHTQEVIESGETHAEVYESYDKITTDLQRFFRELDHASTVLQNNALLGEANAQTLASQLRSKLDYLRGRLDRINPAVGEAAPGEEAAETTAAPEALPRAAEMAG